MSTKRKSSNKLINSSVEAARKHPSLSVQEAMILGGFSRKAISRDSSDNGRNLQQQVYWRLGKRTRDRAPSPRSSTPPPERVSLKSPNSFASVPSSITAASASSKSETPSNHSTRRRSAQVAKDRTADATNRRLKKEAHKRATTLFAKEMETTEKAKKDKTLKKGWSASKVKLIVESEYGKGNAPSVRTIQEHVARGSVGESPVRRGNPGKIAETTFLMLCNAFESYIRISQLNGKAEPRKLLSSKIKLVMEKLPSIGYQHLLNRVLQECALNLLGSKAESVEQRRIMWTSYYNLRMWFNSWFRHLEELGFAHRDSEGELHIPDDQLSRILNIDETCLSVDGSQGARGGRPNVTFFDPRLPQIGRGTSKSSNTTTMVTGSTAAGEPIPPHFQFSTKAKNEDHERIRLEMVHFFRKVKGKFGCEEVRPWSVTIGLNEKGGMDDDEFYKLVKTNIIPLYPDMKDEPGARVMAKVDSGPGRLAQRLLTYCRNLGLYLYPSVPNSTAVSQETDRNYGPFKHYFRVELDNLMTARIDANEGTNMPPWMIGLLVFGKNADPISGYYVSTSPFALAFSKEQNLKAWAAVGAAPPTAACLQDKKVRREIGDADDDMNTFMLEVQQANDLAVKFLKDLGYKGELLASKIKKVRVNEDVTLPNTRERQEAIANAVSHGGRFLATRGDHLTSDDAFMAAELTNRKADVAKLEADKVKRVAAARTHSEGMAVKALGKPVQQLIVKDLDKVLDMHQVSKKDRGKKEEKLAKVSELWSKDPPTFDRWTAANEEELKEKKEMKIEMKDTALGRYQAQEKLRVHAAVGHMDDNERADLLEHIMAAEDNRQGPLMNEIEKTQEEGTEAPC